MSYACCCLLFVINSREVESSEVLEVAELRFTAVLNSTRWCNTNVNGRVNKRRGGCEHIEKVYWWFSSCVQMAAKHTSPWAA